MPVSPLTDGEASQSCLPSSPGPAISPATLLRGFAWHDGPVPRTLVLCRRVALHLLQPLSR